MTRTPRVSDVRPSAPEWPSCYYHDKCRLFLVIYVDDFKLAGPEANVAKGWAALRRGLSIEAEERVSESCVSYVGCKLTKSVHRTTEGQMATALTYEMSCLGAATLFVPKTCSSIEYIQRR